MTTRRLFSQGSPTSLHIFSAMMTSRKERRGWISVHVLKYGFATLIQGVAPALRHQALEQPSYLLYSIYQMFQFRELSLRECLPAFRSASDIAEAKKQLSDFSQCETELTGTLNDRNTVKHPLIVTSLPTEPLCRRKQANLLVVPKRRGAKVNLPCDLRDSQLGHASF